ncbi:hypothetical protein GOODEAATRI_003061, partial [Goodea atripinnis]
QDGESAERAYAEEIASVTLSAQEREKKLAVMLQKMEAEHLQRGWQMLILHCELVDATLIHFYGCCRLERVGDMENLMGSQNSLNRKLKEECCKLGAKLEELSHHSRSELEQLTLEKQHLEDTVKRLRARCSEMEEQCVQHGRMHQRMKDRCANLCIGFH